MAYLYLKLSTSKELNTSSESLSSNLSTSDNSFTWSSEEKEEDEVYFQNNLDVSDECECDQCYSGAYRESACGPRTVCWFISSLNNEITDLRNNKQHLQENLIKKDREIKDNISVIEKLEEQFKMVSEKLEQIRNTTDKRIQELEEQLSEKDQNTTEKTKAIHSLENQCKITPELEEKLNKKDRDIIEKNKVIAAFENQCKLIQELEETLNEKDKDIKEKNNTIAALENQCQMIQEFEEILKKKDIEITENNEAFVTLKKQCEINEKKFKKTQIQCNSKIKKNKTALEEKESEIKRLQKYEEIHPALQAKRDELQKKLDNYGTTLAKANGKTIQLTNELRTAGKEKEELLHRIQEFEEKLNKKDSEITEKNEAFVTLKNQCEINKQEFMKTQIQYNSEIKKNKTALEEKESEIKRLQKYEEIHPALQAKRDELQKKLDNNGTTLAKANGKIKQLTNELRTAGKEKEELLHRLSKIAGAKLTYNNPNIADLSDQKRPTKLAEEFAELYDNEWTDAFEDVDIESDEDKVAYMLSLLKKAYGLCKIASQNHMEKMRSSICKLTLDAEHTSGERNKTSETKCGEVVFDYEKFQDEQKKAVMDLGRFVEIKLSTEFEKIVVDDIASEYSIDKKDRKKLYVYTQKCVNICWSMCRLEIPVAIGLQEVYDGMHLDTSVFKPYTKSGKFVDYIVWPPLYLHENGPLLCKGVAQGKA